jgi:hypothetical protein
MEMLAQRRSLPILSKKQSYLFNIRILTVVISGWSENTSQTSGTEGGEKGVETSIFGDFDNALTGNKGSGTQEDSCDGFDELHSSITRRIQLKQQIKLGKMRKDETPTKYDFP